MTEILPNLYLGSIRNANSKIKTYDVIINLSCEKLKKHVQNKSKIYNFDIFDDENEPIHSLFKITQNIIDFHLNKGYSVLVNCFMGISRSSTIIIAYIMRKYGLTYNKAYNFVRSKRPIINPNKGFIQQLKKNL